jgi:protein Tex
MASPAALDRLCAEFDNPPDHIAAATALLEEGATPAYLARFQRHRVGNLSEDRLHAIAERLWLLNELEQRKQAILQQAEQQGRNTAELQAVLQGSVDQDLIDDIYQSLRPRRRGIALQMEELGLLPLAMAIQHRQLGEQSLQEVATTYLAPDKGLSQPEQVLEGALLILSDKIGHDPATRAAFRQELRHGILRARAVNPDSGASARYREMFDFAEPIGRIPPHRMLALRRAEREGMLTLQLTLPDGRARELLRELHGKDLAPDSPLAEFYNLVFDHAAGPLQEFCGKDVRRRLKEKADREAVRTYARNLRSHLLAPPLGHKKVLALRTSGKGVWAVLLGEDGSVSEHKSLPAENDEQKQAALQWLVETIKNQQPAAIAVPHGRRQAGSERVVAELKKALGETPMPMVVPVDEAASTIFATSADGKKAIQGVEVGIRTAISLGRRLQDPLLELSRMDARTLGLGQTLDDVHQGMLQRELAAVASSCLAQVGCDLNRAPLALLEQLPGLHHESAKAIVDHRRKNGGFQNRASLAEVPGLSPTTVRNIAGFLRITGGSEPLDATPLHPDDYALATAVAQKKGVPATELAKHNLRELEPNDFVHPEADRQRVITVLQQLERLDDDGRGELVATANEGVTSIADLHGNRQLKGRVTSLTEFGAFIDLGIGHDGLAHISQIPNFKLRDGAEMLKVGEVVTVWVMHVDAKSEKISLTMHQPRHLAEGRSLTIGERMEQQQGGGRPRREGRERDGERGGERGPRGPRGPRQGREQPRGRMAGQSVGERRPPGEPGRDGDRKPFGRDRDDREERGPRGRPGQQRVYTVEPAREAASQRTHKGEFTSLANLRALLGKGNQPAQSQPAPQPTEPSTGGDSAS